MNITKQNKSYFFKKMRLIAKRYIFSNNIYNPLTRLINRKTFIQYLEKFLRRSNIDPEFDFALIMIDIDSFNVFNHGLGLEHSDKLLQEFALRLQEDISKRDILCHLEGDKFIALISDCHSNEQAIQAIAKIRNMLSYPFYINNDTEIFFTVSIGVVLCDHKYSNFFDIMRDVDTALHESKKNGKGMHCIFQRQMLQDCHNRLNLERELRLAIINDELTLYYQPIFSISSQSIIGCEALLRWNHPKDGLKSAFDIISLAEENGTIVEIGEWVLRRACLDLKDIWQASDYNIKVSVNVSPRQVHDHHNFAKTCLSIIRQCDIDPSMVTLEITEGLLMQNSSHVQKVFEYLHENRISVSLDDFGTGYSSLSYLKNFPISNIKIDRSFIMDLENSEMDQQITLAIIAMSHSLKKNVIAEGVETQNQLDILTKFQCDQIQGYYFSKPIPKNDFISLLNKASDPYMVKYGDTKYYN